METCKITGLFLDFEHFDEGLLRYLDFTELAHFLFAFLLFFEEFALARDVASVTLCGDVFAQGWDGLSGDDFSSDGGLDGYDELLSGDEFFEFLTDLTAEGLSFGSVHQRGECIDVFAVESYVQLDEIALAVV